MIIYKHALWAALNTVPEGTVRKVAFQNGALFAWIEQHAVETRFQTLVLVPTGEEVPFMDSMQFVDTAVSDNLVLHVYKRCM